MNYEFSPLLMHRVSLDFWGLESSSWSFEIDSVFQDFGRIVFISEFEFEASCKLVSNSRENARNVNKHAFWRLKFCLIFYFLFSLNYTNQ